VSKSDFDLGPNNPQEMSHISDCITPWKNRQYFPRDIDLESCIAYCVLLFRQSTVSQYNVRALIEVSRVMVTKFLKFSF